MREQLLLVVAIMVKRASVEERSEIGEERSHLEVLRSEGSTEPGIVSEFLTEVSRLIRSGDSTVVCTPMQNISF